MLELSDEIQSAGTEAARPRRYGPGLSGKLLLLTILIVMVAVVLVFVPSVSNFRKQWLSARPPLMRRCREGCFALS